MPWHDCDSNIQVAIRWAHDAFLQTKKQQRMLFCVTVFALAVYNLAGTGNTLIGSWTFRGLSNSRSTTAGRTTSSSSGSSNSSNTSETRVTKSTAIAAFESRKWQATTGLSAMRAQDRMTTAFSSRTMVLDRGFPRSRSQWRPCALERVFQSKKTSADPVTVVVVGGSTAARPGKKHCSLDEQDGRHSGQLNKKLAELAAAQQLILGNHSLDEHIMKFQVRNYAQGGSNSVTQALLMDGYINPNETDIIIWDFLTNGMLLVNFANFFSWNSFVHAHAISHSCVDSCAGGGPKERAQKLDFWLTRIYVLFQDAQRPLPLIVILCLWVDGARDVLGSSDHNESNLLDSRPQSFYGPLLDKFKEFGWDIALLNVGGAVNSTILTTPRGKISLLLEDTNHANCAGTGLMGDMIQHLFYTNLAMETCTLERLQEEPPKPSLPTPLSVRTEEMTKEKWRPWWQDMFRPDVKIGSLSVWEPTVPNLTNLRLENDTSWQQMLRKWPPVLMSTHSQGRDDKKMGVVLPKCSTTKNKTTASAVMVRIPLREPNLKWLAIGVSDSESTSVYVNGVNVNDKGYAPDWHHGPTPFKLWIDLRGYITELEQADVQTISFCHFKGDLSRDSRRAPALNFLAGIIGPPTGRKSIVSYNRREKDNFTVS
jgi:hypothetical protein